MVVGFVVTSYLCFPKVGPAQDFVEPRRHRLPRQAFLRQDRRGGGQAVAILCFEDLGGVDQDRNGSRDRIGLRAS